MIHLKSFNAENAEDTETIWETQGFFSANSVCSAFKG